MNAEEKYLRDLYENISYDEKWLRIYLEDNTYIFGALTPDNNEENSLSDIVKYRVLFDTILDTDWKIKISFDKAIKYGLTKEVQENFNPFKEASHEEKISVYFIENALYRLSILWDMLAQLYNLYYDLRITFNRVYYKQLFTSANNTLLFGNEIKNYLEQEDNTDCEDLWQGNHAYMTNLRNQMTHRNSPMISSVSNYGMNIRDFPSYILKRIIEDYVAVSGYIRDILAKIEERTLEAFEGEEENNGTIDC